MEVRTDYQLMATKIEIARQVQISVETAFTLGKM